MGNRLAFVIAVEAYQDQGIPPAEHAEADGAAFSAALTALGFAPENQVVLLGSQATRTAIESRLRKWRKAPPDADVLFVFYAGHAFGADDQGYLTCADSQLDDLTDTSIEIQAFLDALTAYKCGRLALFLDPRAGLPTLDLPADVLSLLPGTELEAAFDLPGRAAFVACGPEQASHPSGPLKSSVWAYHLLQALTGKAPLALENGRELTAESLEHYLEQEVPRTLRTTFKDARTQTPQLYAPEGQRFLVADLGPLLAQGQQPTSDPRLQPLKRGALRVEATMRIKSLGGYRKGVRLPDRISASSQKFVADLASDDIKTDVDFYYAAVREQLGYKRRDVEASYDRGSGCVRTPDFEYSVHVEMVPDDPTTVVWRREVAGIRNPEVVLGRPFANIFGGLFDTLVFEFVKPFDLETWVDRVEDEVPEGVKVRCASDCSTCDVTVAGFTGVIRLRHDRVEVQGRQGPNSKGLVEAFLSFQDLFSGKRDLQALPLSPAPGGA